MNTQQQPKKYHELTDQEKFEKLSKTKAEIDEKLVNLYRNFRGVIHEDSSSEMKYTTIKVYEAQLMSINEELKALSASMKKS